MLCVCTGSSLGKKKRPAGAVPMFGGGGGGLFDESDDEGTLLSLTTLHKPCLCLQLLLLRNHQ